MTTWGTARFWQGGAGIGACWYGGARALGLALHRAVVQSPDSGSSAFRAAGAWKGRHDAAGDRSPPRHAAMWIDAHPLQDAGEVALRVRLAAEACASTVLDQAGRALGAAAFCRDARFARTAADLPVFIRQSHGERDFSALGQRLAAQGTTPWQL